MTSMHEKRVKKMARIQKLLTKQAMTTKELCKRLEMPDATVGSLLREMRFGAAPGEPRVYIEYWTLPESWYVPHYRFGTGEDQANRPKRTPQEAWRVYRDRLKQDPERLEHRRKMKAKREAKYRRNAVPREDRDEVRQAEREQRELQRKAAAIQPRFDPWANLLFGGASKIGIEGVTA